MYSIDKNTKLIRTFPTMYGYATNVDINHIKLGTDFIAMCVINGVHKNKTLDSILMQIELYCERVDDMFEYKLNIKGPVTIKQSTSPGVTYKVIKSLNNTNNKYEYVIQENKPLIVPDWESFPNETVDNDDLHRFLIMSFNMCIQDIRTGFY